MKKALLLAMCVAVTAHAEEENPKVMRARTEAALEKVATEVGEACGIKPATSVDWASFAASKETGYSVSGYCESPLKALTRLCAGPHTKAYVSKHLKTFDCKFGGAKKRGLKVKRGSVVWSVDWHSSNNERFAQVELLKKL